MIHARSDYNEMGAAGIDAKIPDDEPVFLLRGQDQCTINGIVGWIKRAQALGVSDKMIEMARIHIAVIEDWQRQNPDKVKVPDLPQPSAREAAMARVRMSDNVIFVDRDGNEMAAIVTLAPDKPMGCIHLHALPFNGSPRRMGSVPYSSKGMDGSWRWPED